MTGEPRADSAPTLKRHPASIVTAGLLALGASLLLRLLAGYLFVKHRPGASTEFDVLSLASPSVAIPMLLSSGCLFFAIRVCATRWDSGMANRGAIAAWVVFALPTTALLFVGRDSRFALFMSGATLLFSLMGAALGGIDAFNRASMREGDVRRARERAAEEAAADRRRERRHRDG